MECATCGAEAVVRRDGAFYCAKCAETKDWEEIIAVVQNDGGGTQAAETAGAAGEASVSTAVRRPSDPFVR